ncbi:DUF1360 domain-containing protein [Marinomonas mediterranea]|uniref:DUF1360 domain-containing protein n=1 Tax=Marinomonas mediterranea TaxID=119864 RepID=UPI001CBC6E8A
MRALLRTNRCKYRPLFRVSHQQKQRRLRTVQQMLLRCPWYSKHWIQTQLISSLLPIKALTDSIMIQLAIRCHCPQTPLTHCRV